jgi:putative endonuclease
MGKGFLYILECSDVSYYTESTIDLELRLKQHNNGQGAKYTRRRLPVKLLYHQEFQRIDDAFYREKQVQGWTRKKKKALIEKNYCELSKFAECQNESHFAQNETSTTLSHQVKKS